MGLWQVGECTAVFHATVCAGGDRRGTPNVGRGSKAAPQAPCGNRGGNAVYRYGQHAVEVHFADQVHLKSRPLCYVHGIPVRR